MKILLKINILAIAILLGISIRSIGQVNEIPKEMYQASVVPDTLKKHASSVVRYSEIVINITGPGRATIKLHSIVTLLDEKAEGLASMTMGYNKKYDTYSGIELGVYDANGALIKKYHKSDMYDGSAANTMVMVTDERFLSLKHHIAAYPVTIEKEYSEDLNSFIDLGQWVIQMTGQAIQHSVIKVIVNPSVVFRYKTLNTGIEPIKNTINGLNHYTWEFNDIRELRNGTNAIAWKTLPQILMAVNTFNCYGYPGDFSSWQSFGKWIQSLNSDVSTLNPQQAAEIKKMTDSIKTDEGKARFLYHYLQQNVRYVDIDLGIGGYKPLPATFVDEKKYGDCKALANYMRALLKAVNINSNYVIIGAGTNVRPVYSSFPFNSFNHAILCIPFKNDTTWLECTSNTQPFGKLGPFTENRTALLIDNDGGKLVNTPGSMITDNQFNSEASITLSADGSAKNTIKIATTGAYRSHYLAYNSLSTDQQKQFYTRLLNMRQFSDLNIVHTGDDNGVNQIDLIINYDKFCDIISEDKLFLRPFAFDLSTYNIPVEENRKTDFHFDFPMVKSCKTTIVLPAGFEVETIPPNTSLKFTYGSYEISYVYDKAQNRVINIAKFNINSTTIPPEKYTELQQFIDAVSREQRRKLVLHRKD